MDRCGPLISSSSSGVLREIFHWKGEQIMTLLMRSLVCGKVTFRASRDALDASMCRCNLECTYTGTAHPSAHPPIRSSEAPLVPVTYCTRTNKLIFIKSNLGLIYNDGSVPPPSAGGDASVSSRGRYEPVEAPINVTIPEARGTVRPTARTTQHEVISRLDGLWQQKGMVMGDGAVGYLRVTLRPGWAFLEGLRMAGQEI
jgi:hypothetical protein